MSGGKAVMVWKILAVSGGVLAFACMIVSFFRERKIEKKRKEYTAFFAALTHELRTPLNAIIGFTELLAFDDNSKEEQKKFISDISLSANTLLEMINRLLDYARLDVGKMLMHTDFIDMKQLISDIEIMLNPLLAEKNLTLKLDLSGDFPFIETDPERMRQILLNLLGNAIKFSENSTVILHCSFKKKISSHGTLTIKVEDKGQGIAKKDHKRIFDPFTQQDRHSKQGAGSGLGLAIVARIIKLMRGNISLESDIGKGAIFTIHLPDVKYISQKSSP